MSHAAPTSAPPPAPSSGRVLVIYAHPYPNRSTTNRALLRGLEGLEGVAVRSLYELYPDLVIDAESEKEALVGCEVLVWQHPLYWYSAPALLKLWFEKVLQLGWAYGKGGRALAGKRCLWVTTTGGDEESYSPAGSHQRLFSEFEPVMAQTARFCGMEWLEPLVVHHAHHLSPGELSEAADRYRARVQAFLGG